MKSKNSIVMNFLKKLNLFTKPDVNTREVGRTRDKRRKLRREEE